MPLVRIAGPDDPRLALYRNVSDPELLRTHGLFVGEGRLVVQRLIESGRFRVRSLLVNEAAWRALEPCCGPPATSTSIWGRRATLRISPATTSIAAVWRSSSGRVHYPSMRSCQRRALSSCSST